MNTDRKTEGAFGNLEIDHQEILHSRRAKLACISLILLFVFVLSLFIGYYSLSFEKIVAAINNSDFTQPDFQVLFTLRLPRAILALMSGFALGASGYLIQIIFNNPLGDPYIMGFSSASNLGVTLAITQSFVIAGSLMAGTVCLSLIFCLACIALDVIIYKLAGSRRNLMVLVGVALMLFFQAISMALQYFSNPETIKAISFWSTGNLTKSNWISCFILFITIVICSYFLSLKRDGLRFISLGDEMASSMGSNPERLRLGILLCIACMVSVVVSFVGVIGFVGLLAPHLYRLIMTHDDGSNLNESGLVGALLLLISDLIGRIVLSPIIVPIGIVTSIIGIPIFIYFLMKGNNGYDY